MFNPRFLLCVGLAAGAALWNCAPRDGTRREGRSSEARARALPAHALYDNFETHAPWSAILEEQRTKAFREPYNAFAIGPRGRLLAIATGRIGSTIGIWDARKLQLIRTMKDLDIGGYLNRALQFSPDGAMLAASPSCAEDDQNVVVYSVPSGKALGVFGLGVGSRVSGARFDGKSKYLVVSGNTVRGFDAPKADWWLLVADPKRRKVVFRKRVDGPYWLASSRRGVIWVKAVEDFPPGDRRLWALTLPSLKVVGRVAVGRPVSSFVGTRSGVRLVSVGKRVFKTDVVNGRVTETRSVVLDPPLRTDYTAVTVIPNGTGIMRIETVRCRWGPGGCGKGMPLRLLYLRVVLWRGDTVIDRRVFLPYLKVEGFALSPDGKFAIVISRRGDVLRISIDKLVRLKKARKQGDGSRRHPRINPAGDAGERGRRGRRDAGDAGDAGGRGRRDAGKRG